MIKKNIFFIIYHVLFLPILIGIYFYRPFNPKIFIYSYELFGAMVISSIVLTLLLPFVINNFIKKYGIKLLFSSLALGVLILAQIATLYEIGLTSAGKSKVFWVVAKVYYSFGGRIGDRYLRRAPYVANRIYHDYAMYIEHGLVAESIKGFVENKSDFISVHDVMMNMIVPYKDRKNALSTSRFFGVRKHVIKGNKGEFYIATTTHPDPNCISSKCKAGVYRVPSGGNDRVLFAEDLYVELDMVDFFDHDRFNAMYGHTQADIDGDGAEEFLFQDKIYFSKSYLQETASEAWMVVEGERASFVKNPSGVKIVSYDKYGNALKFFSYRDKKLIVRYEFSLGNNKPSDQTRFIINPISFASGGANDDHLIVVLNDSLLILRVADNDEVEMVKSVTFGDKLASKSKYNIRIGGIGDFNGDEINDFWLAYRNYDGVGIAWLLDGALLFSGDNVTREDATLIRLDGDAKYSLNGDRKGDGIGSSISYRAGDIDNDGIPDFSIGSHFGLSYSGSIFILSGNNIRRFIEEGKKNLSVSDRHVFKVISVLGSEIAPPFYHETFHDIDHDGYDDLIVSADNDGYAGYNAGAIYILSGEKMANHAFWDLSEKRP